MKKIVLILLLSVFLGDEYLIAMDRGRSKDAHRSGHKSSGSFAQRAEKKYPVPHQGQEFSLEGFEEKSLLEGVEKACVKKDAKHRILPLNSAFAFGKIEECIPYLQAIVREKDAERGEFLVNRVDQQSYSLLHCLVEAICNQRMGNEAAFRRVLALLYILNVNARIRDSLSGLTAREEAQFVISKYRDNGISDQRIEFLQLIIDFFKD